VPDYCRHQIDHLAKRRKTYTFAVLWRGHPNKDVISFLGQDFDGNGGVIDNTGQGLLRVTWSVMPPLIQWRRPRLRRGDMITKSAFSSSATLPPWPDRRRESRLT